MSTDQLQRLPLEFGKLLARLRRERNLTLEAMGEATAISVIDVIDMEAGKREPNLTEFFRIAIALHDPPGILLIDLIAAWRGDSLNSIYAPRTTGSRATDFARIYRLGYYHDHGDFREHPKPFGSIDQATDAARKLNSSRQRQALRLLDTVCIYVRMGHLPVRLEIRP